MARISRHELKQDEFIQTVNETWEWVQRQHTALIVAVVTVVVGLAGFGGYRVYAENQMAKADAALGKAIRTFHAQILPPGTPKPPTDEPTFGTEQARNEAALKEFTELRRHYPRTPAARLAEYYVALCQEALGKQEEAIKILQSLAAGRDRDAHAIASYHLASLYLKMGKGAEAEKLYLDLLAKPSFLIPKTMAMMALADYYRDSKPNEAAKLYEEVKRDFPDTVAAATATDNLRDMGRGQ